MNGKIKVLTMVLFSLLLLGCLPCNSAQAAEKKAKERLAVLDLEAKYGVDKGLAEALSVIVRDKLHSFGDYQVMSKGDIQAVASREQLKQVIGCDDDGSQCLLDFGRAIGTRFMVAGDISKIGSTYTVSLRMLDTQGDAAGVTNRVNEDCKCDDDALIGTVRDVAAKLVGKPTSTAIKKAEEEKKLTVEKKKTEETEEKNKAVEVEKQRLAAEIEKQKKEKKTATQETTQKLIVAENKPFPAVTASAYPSTSKTFTDPTTSIEFVLVPGGCFQMGDTFGQGTNNKEPVHEVCVDDFYMGKYEVTQGQYRAIIGNNPSNFQKGDNYPVEQVSWNDAQSFIRSLNSKAGGHYRLPTEAEWEYAARSGGKNEKYAGGNDIEAVAWYADNSGNSTHPVGLKRPNGLNLYDMSGNVREWCEDGFGGDYYVNSPKKNPEGPSSATRVNRGGSWRRDAVGARAADRVGNSSAQSGSAVGFRLVLPVGAAKNLKVTPKKTVSPAGVSPSLPTSKAYTDSTTGMEFVYVPGGCFKMGQTEEEKAQLIKDEGKDRYDKEYSRELPQHEVCVDAFYMGKFEVTLGEWQKFIKATNYMTNAEKNTERKGCGLATSWQNYSEGLYWNDVGFSQSDRHPVGCISYNDSIEFIEWLGRQNKTNYRLPTEAEWEYAARAGTTDSTYGMNGSDNICKYANSNDRSRDLTKLFLCNDGYVESAPVGRLQSNKFGLYDMLGNVYEWTSDWFGKGYYGKSPKDNPSGAPPGITRVFRGGGWASPHVRFAMRNDWHSWFRITDLGFRLVHPVHTESLNKENQ